MDRVRRWLRRYLEFLIGVVVVGVILAIIIECPPWFTLWPCKGANVEITYPVNGQLVPQVTQVFGTASKIPSGATIWVCIRPQGGLYYPQYPPVRLEPDDGWHSEVVIGELGDKGSQFLIVLIIADEMATQQLQDYAAQCEHAGTWPGMKELPAGAKSYHEIVVTRE